MEYLIFSDESGTWNDGKYYVRSWIKIDPVEYNLLRKEILFTKQETGVKELKWEKFRKNYTTFRSIFNIHFEVFVTISKPDHFHVRRYSIIKAIEDVPESTGGQSLTNKIKKKIISAAKNELFLNYFEKVHIENSIKALVDTGKIKKYKYLIDTPQYLDREWVDLCRECGILEVEIMKDSSVCPGIELADVISGCISDLINRKNEAEKSYNECVKSKMINMACRSCPNPNLIFYPDFSEQEKNDLNIFR